MRLNIIIRYFLFLAIAITLSSTVLIGQSNPQKDSLLSEIKSCSNDSCRSAIYLELGDLYENTFPDSAIYFYKKSYMLALPQKNIKLAATAIRYIGIVLYNKGQFSESITMYLKSIELYKSINDQNGLTSSYNNIGLAYSDQGKFETAKEYYEKAMKIHLGNLSACKDNSCEKDKMGISNNLTNISLIYLHQGNNLKAIEYQLKALKIKEALLNNCNDKTNCLTYKQSIARCYNNIGIIHYNQKSYKKAQEFSEKALVTYLEIDDQLGVSYCYGNLGNLFSDMGLTNNNPKQRQALLDSSLVFYYKSLAISEKLNDQGSISSCYNNIGTVLMDNKRYDEAISIFKKAIEIYNNTEDLEGKAVCFGNISDLYLILADSCSLTENQSSQYILKAIEYGENAFELSQKINTLPTKNDAARALMRAYKKQGNTTKALEYAEQYINTKDILYNEEHSKSLSELSTKYETDKKEKENELLRMDQQLKDSTIKRQYILSFSVSIGLLLMLLLAFILYRSDKKRKKINQLLTAKNIEIQQKNEEILAQRDEISSQRDMVVFQKEQIENIHVKLTDSIDYASLIQQAVLPDISEIMQTTDADKNNYFIIFKPKDVVSGDFYWATRVREWSIFAVADCTGHGVPGAFMSMLGLSFLNEIVRKKEVIKTSEVLDQLRIAIIDALKQKGVSGEQKDGMDICLCAYNNQTHELQYSGANNPLYIIKAKVEHSTSPLTSILIELKGDKMPIGIHERMHPFTLHTHQLEKGDTLYLMSDGYQDQFGGPSGKKFMTKQIREKLILLSGKDMNDQKMELENILSDWSKHFEQVDDITIMGIRI
ncbi:MAG: hypothetical protein CVU05_15550 [Bacteroidetes bacterium HGW-Bacteroidetes-21]|jgi:tetratricopeptide (TPR) repeat protein|nr:MAG: hypothetical protein CVU05_15550 [Bacteroidetes bacterium HGW-Bacteroidetes-21]